MDAVDRVDSLETVASEAMVNILTIDVEDYYMVSSFADTVRFEDWLSYESRVERNTKYMLDLLDEYGVRATFFTLGWVSERFPALVREIGRRGHELACHGYNHRLVYDLSVQEFREDTRRSKSLIEDLTGKRVIGYRATSYSIMEQCMWAIDVLIEEGFLYDSSIFPIRHDRYGYPGFHRFPVTVKRQMKGEILEIPPSTIRIMGNNIPFASGGYLRLLPIGFTQWGIRHLNHNEGQPAIVCVHPWELDAQQPRLNGSRLSMFRHYVNIKSTAGKLCHLLSTFNFGTVREFRELNGGAAKQGSEEPVYIT